MIELRSLDENEMCAYLKEHGFPAFRGKQLFSWVHQKGIVEFAEMSNLGKELTAFLQANATVCSPKIVKEQINHNQDSAKLLLEFADGILVEIVIMLYERKNSRDRQTVCISTQAGCGMGCAFCATGLNGLERNLTAGEIVSQVLAADAWCEKHGYTGISNVVYMGMGEPLANLAAVLKSISLLNHEKGLKIGQRRITVSTCGLVPQINEMAEKKLAIGLAVSLHATNDELRNKIMPINQKYPIQGLIGAAQNYSAKTGRRVTYEYALFEGVNDSQKEALALAKLLKGQLAHVNLIKANLVKETGFLPAKPETLQKFAEAVAASGVEVTLRESRGSDIDAACGQLRRHFSREVQK
ncbi:MAG: 23S rRNA (adenine(2503)-C(2))-methyltransferase RlmN [Clostridia bacterium]|jgi:23S rRNA (adenine2503-C2)-methyltransferase|nr:23S rRNA (adenine(2503)-C(2))-methyltransferase RlmN [Clostridia bacterium]